MCEAIHICPSSVQFATQEIHLLRIEQIILWGEGDCSVSRIIRLEMYYYRRHHFYHSGQPQFYITLPPNTTLSSFYLELTCMCLSVTRASSDLSPAVVSFSLLTCPSNSFKSDSIRLVVHDIEDNSDCIEKQKMD